MKPDQVGMLPIYIGAKGEENQGLATASSENCLCVNAKASEADQKASKDFLNWVVTSDEGIKALSEDMGFTTPFKTFDQGEERQPARRGGRRGLQIPASSRSPGTSR